jgi:hypothetical protein
MRMANITAVVSVTIWVLLLLTGVTGIRRISHQHVQGYPDPLQVQYYIGVPTVLVTILLTAVMMCNRGRQSPTGLGFVTAFSLLYWWDVMHLSSVLAR